MRNGLNRAGFTRLFGATRDPARARKNGASPCSGWPGPCTPTAPLRFVPDRSSRGFAGSGCANSQPLRRLSKRLGRLTLTQRSDAAQLPRNSWSSGACPIPTARCIGVAGRDDRRMTTRPASSRRAIQRSAVAPGSSAPSVTLPTVSRRCSTWDSKRWRRMSQAGPELNSPKSLRRRWRSWRALRTSNRRSRPAGVSIWLRESADRRPNSAFTSCRAFAS